MPPTRREPVFNVPPAVLLVILVLVVAHCLRLAVSDTIDNEILLRLSFIPGAFTYAFDPAAVLSGLRTLAEQGDVGVAQAQLGRSILTVAGVQPWTVFTYGLLHADWTHIGLNALWLLAFGSPVARRLGTLRFLAFLAAATVAGAAAHYITHRLDLQPVIGASAAVSACMGAALRFMFQPQVPASAVKGLGEPERTAAFRPPLQPFRTLLRERRPLAFLGAWFVANLLFGLGIVAVGAGDGIVAWQAHIGGFMFGLLTLRLFDREPFGDPPSREPPPPETPDSASPGRA